jgi:hypothetical protein
MSRRLEGLEPPLKLAEVRKMIDALCRAKRLEVGVVSSIRPSVRLSVLLSAYPPQMTRFSLFGCALIWLALCSFQAQHVPFPVFLASVLGIHGFALAVNHYFLICRSRIHKTKWTFLKLSAADDSCAAHLLRTGGAWLAARARAAAGGAGHQDAVGRSAGRDVCLSEGHPQVRGCVGAAVRPGGGDRWAAAGATAADQACAAGS